MTGMPEDLDQRLAEVQKLAVESGSITPLLKFELSCKIQSKRLEEGKPELQVSFDLPSISQPLTPEEEEKKKTERQKNREAAQRMRKKENQKIQNALKTIQEMQENISQLEYDKHQLVERKMKVIEQMRNHRCFYDDGDESLKELPKKCRLFCRSQSAP